MPAPIPPQLPEPFPLVDWFRRCPTGGTVHLSPRPSTEDTLTTNSPANDLPGAIRRLANGAIVVKRDRSLRTGMLWLVVIRPDGMTNGVLFDDELGDSQLVGAMPHTPAAQHIPSQIGTHDAEGFRTHTIPGDVCLGCSSPATGLWVPVSQCQQATAALDAEVPW